MSLLKTTFLNDIESYQAIVATIRTSIPFPKHLSIQTMSRVPPKQMFLDTSTFPLLRQKQDSVRGLKMYRWIRTNISCSTG